ncbi:MAG TPA: flagellar assembly protein FliH, partial [Alphaproteobacteria bacterium]|nr:flagellar assembly protein FliH [Alphaproteobacteria bacterium]
MSAAPVRFTFDLDLGRREEKNRLLTESAMAAMLEDARTAGFAEGFAAGEQGATAKAARQLATAAAELGERVAALSASLDDIKKTTLREAVDLAASIARKLAGNLVNREPTAEIEALIAECLASLEGVPHLVIRCNMELADAVREIATGRIETSGFGGRLVVMGEPDIPPGDCRLEWADGGLVRDRASLEAEIDR